MKLFSSLPPLACNERVCVFKAWSQSQPSPVHVIIGRRRRDNADLWWKLRWAERGRGKKWGLWFSLALLHWTLSLIIYIFCKKIFNPLTTTYVDLTSSFWLWVQRMDCWILTLRLHGVKPERRHNILHERCILPFQRPEIKDILINVGKSRLANFPYLVFFSVKYFNLQGFSTYFWRVGKWKCSRKDVSEN